MTTQKVLRAVSATPFLLGLLYDLNLLPEQLKENSREWMMMCAIVIAYERGKKEGEKGGSKS